MMSDEVFDRYSRIFCNYSSSLAYVDQDLLYENSRRILRLAGSRTIRIASKSVRCAGVLRKIFALSPRYRGLLTYSASETIYLAKHGFDDLLLAYPTGDVSCLQDLLVLVRSGSDIKFVVDSKTHVDLLSRLAQQLGTHARICIDLDVSLRLPFLHFGVYRSPIRSISQTMELIDYTRGRPNIEWLGFMAYEAQIAGLPDRDENAIRRFLIRWLKKCSLVEMGKKRSSLVNALNQKGLTYSLFNGGGTGSLSKAATFPELTEVTVGSGFFAPKLFDGYDGLDLLPAAGFALEVARIPERGIYTCTGGGFQASGAASRDKSPEPYLPKGARLIPNEGGGEVQTPIRYSGELNIGQKVFFRHAKAGELCEGFDRILWVANGKVEEELKTYRGEGECFH